MPCGLCNDMQTHFRSFKRRFIAIGAAWSLCTCSGAATRAKLRPFIDQQQHTMQMTPVIAVHMTAAILAVTIGPFVLWARLGKKTKPWLHRGLGYAWVTLMVAAAVSAIFIRDFSLPNIAGYTPIHLLIPYTLLGLFKAFQFLAKKDIQNHRKAMLGLYVGACLIAGAFTLLPNRYLGNLVWHQWLGLI